MLSEDEKENIRIRRDRAKANCSRVYKLVLEQKKALNEVLSAYSKWKAIYEEEDRKLALEEKLTKVAYKAKAKKEVVLTIDQVMELARRLGVKLPELE